MHILILASIFKSIHAKIVEKEKNQIAVLSTIVTIVFFIFSLMVFVVSWFSLAKHRRIRRFQLSEPQTNVFYKDKGKTPKLRRKVILAMNKEGGVKAKLKKSWDKSKKSSDSEKSASETEHAKVASQERI